MTRMLYATLVGIDAYQRPVPALNGCVNDIEAIASLLKEFGKAGDFVIELAYTLLRRAQVLARLPLREERSRSALSWCCFLLLPFFLLAYYQGAKSGRTRSLRPLKRRIIRTMTHQLRPTNAGTSFALSTPPSVILLTIVAATSSLSLGRLTVTRLPTKFAGSSHRRRKAGRKYTPFCHLRFFLVQGRPSHPNALNF